MDPQLKIEMAHNAAPEDRGNRPSKDATEEQFLKDLYLFMKKRDTPIERIPHLGFKQVDLYLMYKAVKDLGGYHQVTAQQLWKQVYNTLGGNPRSTSAATCTRRHYEKLMLPYECHVKGLCLNAVQQPRSYHYMEYRKLEEDGPPPAKRRPELFLLQRALGDMSEHHSAPFPLSPSFHKFGYSPYALPPMQHSQMLPPYLPVLPPPPYPSRTPPTPNPIECLAPARNPTDHPTDPLEHLRFLAKQYESSAGLSEPLNLSVKAAKSDFTTNPASSFAPPSTNKNPKFLNKPSPLYMSPNTSVKGDANADEGPSSLSSPKDSSSCKSQAAIISTNQHKRDTTERLHNPDVRSINKLIPSTAVNGGRMEIEIPLSVFNNWLQMYGPQAILHNSKQPLIQEDSKGKSTAPETTASNLTFEIKRKRSEAGHSQHEVSQICKSERVPPGPYTQNSFTSAHTVLNNVARRDVYLLNDLKRPSNVKSVPSVCWDFTGNGGGPTLPKQVDVAADAPASFQRARASKAYAAEEQHRPESGGLQLNSTSPLQLTPEEVRKLRKIISNSA